MNPIQEFVLSAQKRGAEHAAVELMPVTHDELMHLMCDTILHLWRLEAKGLTGPEDGYDSRKALLEKLKRFDAEHFQQRECEG